MLMMKWTSHFPGKEKERKCWKKTANKFTLKWLQVKYFEVQICHKPPRSNIRKKPNKRLPFCQTELLLLPPFCRPCLTYFWYLVNKNKLQKNKNFSQTVFQSQLSLLSSISNEQLICVGALPVFRWLRLRYKVLQLLSARIFGVARCFTFSCTVC